MHCVRLLCVLCQIFVFVVSKYCMVCVVVASNVQCFLKRSMTIKQIYVAIKQFRWILPSHISEFMFSLKMCIETQ